MIDKNKEAIKILEKNPLTNFYSPEHQIKKELERIKKEERTNLTEDVINTCYDVMAVESRPNAKEFVDESTLLYKAVHSMTADQKLKYQKEIKNLCL